MTLGARHDPYLGFNFLVEIQGLTVGGFQEVRGLEVEVEAQDYREGGVNDFIHKLPGPTRYPSNLTLRHGLVDAETLWDWHRAVRQGKIQRRNVSIILRDSREAEVRRWEFADTYPVKWTGPDLRAGTAEVAIEALELVHRGLL